MDHRARVRVLRVLALCLWFALRAAPGAAEEPFEHPDELRPVFEHLVEPRLSVPDDERRAYAQQLTQALGAARVPIERTQFVVLVDRSAWVQAAMVWWIAADGSSGLIGAAPASTGRPSGFEHFETPLGAFEHSLNPLDFRAEGTLNAYGIRGYGDRGRRVFDFGWVMGRRAWAPGEQLMRLQLHATDRDRLEPRLGQRESKGCIRVSAGLNEFLDRFAVLDAAYEDGLREGRSFWVLRADRIVTPWPGRWLVVVESQREARPEWSPAPSAARADAGFPPSVC
jgi:hypothetical protein